MFLKKYIWLSAATLLTACLLYTSTVFMYEGNDQNFLIKKDGLIRM